MLTAAAQAQLHAQTHQFLVHGVIMTLLASQQCLCLALPCDDDPGVVLPCNGHTDVALPNDDAPREIIVHTQTLKRSMMTSGTVKKKPFGQEDIWHCQEETCGQEDIWHCQEETC